MNDHDEMTSSDISASWRNSPHVSGVGQLVTRNPLLGSREVGVQVRLYGTIEWVRNIGRHSGSAAPRYLGYFISIADVCLSADDLAHDVKHHPAGVRVRPLAQAADGSHGKPGFLARFPDGGLIHGLAGFHFPPGNCHESRPSFTRRRTSNTRPLLTMTAAAIGGRWFMTAWSSPSGESLSPMTPTLPGRYSGMVAELRRDYQAERTSAPRESPRCPGYDRTIWHGSGTSNFFSVGTESPRLGPLGDSHRRRRALLSCTSQCWPPDTA